MTIPQFRCAQQLPLHKGAFGLHSSLPALVGGDFGLYSSLPPLPKGRWLAVRQDGGIDSEFRITNN